MERSRTAPAGRGSPTSLRRMATRCRWRSLPRLRTPTTKSTRRPQSMPWAGQWFWSATATAVPLSPKQAIIQTLRRWSILLFLPSMKARAVRRSKRRCRKHPRRSNRTAMGFKRTLDCLQSYPWPGNVRELQNVIERSVIVSETDEFTVDESWLSQRGRRLGARVGLSSLLAAHEKAIVEDALRASRVRVFGDSGAAARLGIPRSTLESRIRALKIDKRRFRTLASIS